MEEFILSVLSQAKDTRLFVIEHSVNLEEIVSDTIGRLLDINWKESKSLGFNKFALSFGQKVLLIQDKKNIPKIISTKLQVFMQIRNKFAHVKSIDSFESYFKFSTECNNDKIKLEKWYLHTVFFEGNDEEKYKYYFFKLFDDIFMFLNVNITIQHAISDSQKKVTCELNEKFITLLKQEVSKSPELNKIWNEMVNRIPES